MDTNTSSSSNSGSLPPLPPLPADTTNTVVPTPSVEPVAEAVAVTPVTNPAPVVEAPVQTPVSQAPVNFAPAPMQTTPEPEPPVVHLIEAPTSTKVEAPIPQPVNNTNSPVVSKQKSDKFNVMIAVLAFVLFLMLGLVGYLVIQVLI